MSSKRILLGKNEGKGNINNSSSSNNNNDTEQ